MALEKIIKQKVTHSDREGSVKPHTYRHWGYNCKSEQAFSKTIGQNV